MQITAINQKIEIVQALLLKIIQELEKQIKRNKIRGSQGGQA